MKLLSVNFNNLKLDFCSFRLEKENEDSDPSDQVASFEDYESDSVSVKLRLIFSCNKLFMLCRVLCRVQ